MFYYKSQRDDQLVVDAVLAIANKHPRYGCPTIAKMSGGIITGITNELSASIAS
jgi:hypothetical protein